MRRALLGLMLLAAACGIDAGTVTSRSYKDPYVDWVTLCSGTGTTVSCMVYPSHMPECWQITFSDGKDDNSVCVGRSTWDSFAVGDHFDVNQVEVAS